MTDTPWDKKKKLAYQRQEERLARSPRTRQQPNSGRTWRAPGDAKTNNPAMNVLTDAKGTERNSFTIERRTWLEYKRRANATPPGCSPAFQIDIQDDVHLTLIETELWEDVQHYIIALEAELATHTD